MKCIEKSKSSWWPVQLPDTNLKIVVGNVNWILRFTTSVCCDCRQILKTERINYSFITGRWALHKTHVKVKVALMTCSVTYWSRRCVYLWRSLHSLRLGLHRNYTNITLCSSLSHEIWTKWTQFCHFIWNQTIVSWVSKTHKQTKCYIYKFILAQLIINLLYSYKIPLGLCIVHCDHIFVFHAGYWACADTNAATTQVSCLSTPFKHSLRRHAVPLRQYCDDYFILATVPPPPKDFRYL